MLLHFHVRKKGYHIKIFDMRNMLKKKDAGIIKVLVNLLTLMNFCLIFLADQSSVLLINYWPAAAVSRALFERLIQALVNKGSEVELATQAVSDTSAMFRSSPRQATQIRMPRQETLSFVVKSVSLTTLSLPMQCRGHCRGESEILPRAYPRQYSIFPQQFVVAD
jgi:hypothetical protein